MKYKKTLLAILIIIGTIFAIAFWSNIVKSPQIQSEIVPETTQEYPEPLGEDCNGEECHEVKG